MNEETLEIKKIELKKLLLKSNKKVRKIEDLLEENYIINKKNAYSEELNELKNTQKEILKLI